jgi:hypothetical protein
MKTSRGAGALIFAALISGGCAASPSQGGQVRVHTTTAAFEHYAPAHGSVVQRTKKSHKESPTAQACKTGSSRACNELGDRLTMKHAHAEARQWYLTSCERVQSSMVPTGARLVQLKQELAQLESIRAVDERDGAANQKRLAKVRNDASEIRAHIQGCLDTGETLKLDGELKQSLKYYDTACEFSTIVEAIGEPVPGLEHVADSGCAGGQSARAQLSSEMPFSPRLFVSMGQQKAQPAAAKQGPAQEEQGMVFSEGDL